MDKGASSFKLGASEKTEKGYRIDLHLTYKDPIRPGREPSTFTWTDALYVVREGERYVVDDIEFLGTWPYGNHGLLSKSLQYRHKE